MSLTTLFFGIFNRDDSYSHELRERAKRQMLMKQEESEQRRVFEERRTAHNKAMYFNHLRQISTQGLKNQPRKKLKLVGYDIWNRPIYK